MADVFQTVTDAPGCFGALLQSIKRVFTGAILFVLAFPLMFWNECSSVEVYQSLQEGAGLVVTVGDSQVDAGQEGHLVHLTGDSHTGEVLKDTDFGVQSVAIKLSRGVEMYQWHEKRKTETRDKKKVTTYTYDTKWSSKVIDSSSFAQREGHSNPSEKRIADRQVTAQNVTVGAFTLSEDQIGRIGGATDRPISQEEVAKLQFAGETVVATQGDVYFGQDPSDPDVGDLRVDFQVVKPGPISIIAKQVGSSFEAYQTHAGRKISMVKSGTHSAESMFDEAIQTNTFLTWGVRFLGFALFFISISLVLGPLRVISSRVPFVGGLFAAGLTAISFLVAAVISLVTIAVAWIVARPLLGIALLFLASLPLMLIAALVIWKMRSAA